MLQHKHQDQIADKGLAMPQLILHIDLTLRDSRHHNTLQSGVPGCSAGLDDSCLQSSPMKTHRQSSV